MGRDVASEERSCPHCQEPAPAGASFCSECGGKLGVSPELAKTARGEATSEVAISTEKERSATRVRDAAISPLAAHYESTPKITERPDSRGATVRPPDESRPPSLRSPDTVRAGAPSSSSSADPLIGAVVADRYRIVSLLGRGGMGVVYKVEHAKIGKVMALKLLTGELSHNKETVQRFSREALLVSKLSHPNTVQVFDYGSSGGLTYLAMEYLNGQDLGELIDEKGPRPFSQMAKIAIQACGALQEAHDKGMVHRDIKPENLFLTRSPSGDDLVKVLDFGLAKLRESRELNQITSSGNIVGTPYYMSPEQVRGEEVDGRADVYGMCALLYTAITGYHLFDAPSPVAVLTQQITGVVVPPHKRAPDLNIPLSVSNIILKGLQKDAGHRYQSVAELASALEVQLSGTNFSRLSLPDTPAFSPDVVEDEVATRNEVESYENSLKRRENMTKVIAGACLLGALGGATHLYLQSQKPPPFQGRELEPNHDVETATRVPFASEVRGRIGKRIAPGRGDQDNFAIEIPRQGSDPLSLVSFSLDGLPNMALCSWIFRAGAQEPLYRFCAPGPGIPIVQPQLAMRPGQYLFVIKQDLDRYGEKTAPLLFENVSDDYELSLVAVEPQAAREIEPNSDAGRVRSIAFPQRRLRLGEANQIKGMLSTMRDVDVVCAEGTGSARFVVYDAEGGTRPQESALRVLPLRGPQHKIPVRIHGGRRGFEVSERDSQSPWTSAPVDLSQSPCLVLELVPNPLAPLPHPVVAPASEHEWRIELSQPPSPTAAGSKQNK